MFVVWAVSFIQGERKKEIDREEGPIDPLLEAKFDAAATRLPGLRLQLDQKTGLKFYGLYKQAILGPADPKDGPYWYETQARTKFNAWLTNGKMSRAEAMEKYIEMLLQIDPEWDPSAQTVGKGGGWNKVPSAMGVIEPEMFDDIVVYKPTRLETEKEKEWFAAMRANDTTTMKRLLEEDRNILEAKDENLAMTALLWATDLGCDPVVRFLIDEGADVNAVDNCLQTPLHFAAQCHRPLLAEILIQAGADKAALDADGLTPAECCDDTELRSALTP
ncbi:CBN-ACBP-5 protein [Caenorhabditis brenneri]|uniref:Acyl-CoA-binding domain-containing protein 6 n=1 Tax=Caenorhabditis brenneri TaxID=135651 RepID=G0ML66_CAEBE|nr:CBN-ACBP-5 protein [Caenorhabditis brenneri]